MVADRSERLPWLHEVPRSAPAVTHRARSKRRLAAPLAGLAFLLLGVGGTAYYWLGTGDRQAEPKADLPASGPVSVAIPEAVPRAPEGAAPAAPILPVPVAEAPPPPIEQTPIVDLPGPPVVKPVRPLASGPDVPDPKLSSRVRERLRHVRAEAKRSEVSRPARSAATRLVPRRVPLVPPGPPGRIVQLGSFTDIPVAQENWRAVAKRWPYLTTKTRILSPIWMRQENGWRLYYRLQLGAASQAQSVVICQRLQKAGQPCVVVY